MSDKLEKLFIKIVSGIIFFAIIFIIIFIYNFIQSTYTNEAINRKNSANILNIKNQNLNIDIQGKSDIKNAVEPKASIENLKNFESNLNKKIILLGKYKVTKITDGDTVHVLSEDGREDIVRIIAINTLEKKAIEKREKCLAKLATKYTEDALLSKQIYLYKDMTQPPRDKYKRLLAYVRLENSSIMYNEQMMQTGLARVYKASPPAVEYAKYNNIMQENINNKIGIWDYNLCK